MEILLFLSDHLYYAKVADGDLLLEEAKQEYSKFHVGQWTNTAPTTPVAVA